MPHLMRKNTGHEIHQDLDPGGEGEPQGLTSVVRPAGGLLRGGGQWSPLRNVAERRGEDAPLRRAHAHC